MLIDTYLKSHNRDDILGLRAFLKNVMNPVQGRAATEETTDEEGNIVPAQEAIGDPAYWYTCVRASFPVPIFGTIEACDEETGVALCGRWA